MTRRGSSFGFFGIFGRSEDLRALDAALRAADLHPALLPEGVKLAAVNRMKDDHGGAYPPEEAFAPVAQLMAYLALGDDSRVDGAALSRRIETALDAPSGPAASLDVDIILLMLHAKLVRADVIDRFGLEIG
jgi:hypothetical protein